MAWPFSTCAAPNFDTGPGQSVPLAATSIQANACWLLGGHFKNVSASERVMTLTNTAGAVLEQLTLPAGAKEPLDFAFRPSTGVKWSIDGGVLGDVLGHVWGYV